MHRHDSHAAHRRDPASSGHPGTPIRIAPVTYTLWQKFLRFDPSDPIWPNRGRYVLSSGHASTLLWLMLHTDAGPSGRSRLRDAWPAGGLALGPQAHPPARLEGAGAPEYRWTSGVEATTGPLGTGAATSVGMAVASQWLAARYNRDGVTLCDFDVTRRPATAA